jgi:hypothetical protein
MSGSRLTFCGTLGKSKKEEVRVKIMKDVIISAAMGSAWDFLISRKYFPELSTQKHTAGPHEKSGPSQKTAAPSDTTEILELTPPTRVSYKSSSADLPLVTTLELSQKGKRTALKVTVTGWEKVDLEMARAQMPGISLEWEKKLDRLKREIETSSRT